MEEPAALRQARLEPDRDVRDHTERPAEARHVLGATREGAELPRGAGTGPATPRLASVHLDTAGGNVHAALRDRDAAEAGGALVELVDNARAARTAA